jgi:hypothetical protein
MWRLVTDEQDGSRNGPGLSAAVCIRDYWDQMTAEQPGASALRTHFGYPAVMTAARYDRSREQEAVGSSKR